MHGRIGKPVALGLLDAGHRVRAVGLDRARLQPLVDRGAEPAVGDIADRAFIERALAGADAALLVARADLGSPTFAAMVAGGASLDFATRMNDTWEIFSAPGSAARPRSVDPIDRGTSSRPSWSPRSNAAPVVGLVS